MTSQSSYAFIHDKLLKQYRRYSLYLLWTAAFNLLGLILTSITLGTGETSFIGYGIFYNHVGLLLGWIENSFNINIWLYLLYAILISAPMSGVMIFLSGLSYRGNKKALYWGVGLYTADTILTALVFFTYQVMDGILSIALHLFSLVILSMAIIKRQQLIKLQKENSDTYHEKEVEGPKVTTVMSFNPKKRKDKNIVTVGEKLNNLDENDKKDVEK